MVTRFLNDGELAGVRNHLNATCGTGGPVGDFVKFADAGYYEGGREKRVVVEWAVENPHYLTILLEKGETHSSSMVYATLEIMTRLAERGLLSEDHLDQAMGVIYDDGDYIDRALGTMWIERNPSLFGKIVSDVEAFLRRHFTVYQMIPVILLHSEVLVLIQNEKRHSFISDGFLTHGARNNGWVKAALKVGLTCPEIASIILARLEKVQVKPGMVNDVEGFLEYGSGSVYHKGFIDKDTPWSVMSDEQLDQAAQICARKAPDGVFKHLSKLSLRLSAQKVEALRGLAIANLPSVLGLSLESVKRWPAAQQNVVFDRLVKELSSTTEKSELRSNVVDMVVSLLLSKDLEEAKNLFVQIKCSIDQMDASMVYRHARVQLKEKLPEGESENHSVAIWLRDELRIRLVEAGYILGQVVAGTNPKGERQYQIDGGDGITYVHDRYSHSYYPATGDLVIVAPRRSSHLTPRVRRCTFVPVALGKDG